MKVKEEQQQKPTPRKQEPKEGRKGGKNYRKKEVEE